jgi:hypothetical protein
MSFSLGKEFSTAVTLLNAYRKKRMSQRCKNVGNALYVWVVCVETNLVDDDEEERA